MDEVRTESYAGSAGRVILARIRRKTDLLTGIIDICRKNNVKTAAVTIAIGSLINAEISWTRPSQTSKRGSERTPPLFLAGPLEFISGQGLFCLDGDRPVVHFHGTVCDKDGKAWAGHFFQGGNPVHSTMDLVIRELKGVRMNWFYDEEIDLELAVPGPDFEERG